MRSHLLCVHTVLIWCVSNFESDAFPTCIFQIKIPPQVIYLQNGFAADTTSLSPALEQTCQSWILLDGSIPMLNDCAKDVRQTLSSQAPLPSPNSSIGKFQFPQPSFSFWSQNAPEKTHGMQMCMIRWALYSPMNSKLKTFKECTQTTG